MRVRSYLAVLCCASLLVSFSGCGNKEGAGSGGSPGLTSTGETKPSPVLSEPGDPMEGARGLVARAKELKGLKDLPDLFTNESAATMAVVLSMPIAMAIGMAMQSPKADEEMKVIKDQMDALGVKYGMDKAGAQPSGLPAGVKARGRELLTEIVAIMDRLGKKMGSQDGGLSLSKNFGPGDVEYKVLGPKAVKLIPKKAGEQTAEARFEDGKWRLDLGSFEDVMSQAMKQQGAGGPGMGGPGTGAPMMPGG